MLPRAGHLAVEGHVPRYRARDRRGARPPDEPRGSVPGLRRTILALASALVALTLAARPATAAEGLFLTWDDCALGATATSNRDFDCLSNSGTHELYCAFTMPLAADEVIAVEIVVDIQHASTPLPNWWQLDVGGCREGVNLTAAADFPDRSACLDMWQGAGTAPTAGVQAYIPTEPRGAASQARIKVAASVLPEEARSLDATSMYYAVRIVLTNDLTVGTPSCAGCDQPACLVLNSILIGRLPGAAGGNYFLQTPGPAGANWARWQGGAGANCAAVPVIKRTWGEIKSLYR